MYVRHRNYVRHKSSAPFTEHKFRAEHIVSKFNGAEFRISPYNRVIYFMDHIICEQLFRICDIIWYVISYVIYEIMLTTSQSVNWYEICTVYTCTLYSFSITVVRDMNSAVCHGLYEPWSEWHSEVWLYLARVMLFSSISGLAIWMVL